MKRILLTILCLMAVTLTACGPDTGTLEINIVKSPNPAEDPLDPNLITHLKIRVSGENMTPVENIFNFDVGGSSTLNEIPAGKNRVVTVEGLAGQEGFSISRGQSVPFEISAGRQRVELFMARIGRFSLTPGFGLSEARFGHATTIDSEGLLWIIGGAEAGTTQSPDAFSSTFEIYNPTSGSLSTFDCADDSEQCLLLPRTDATSALTDDRIYVVGGRNADGLLDSTEEIFRDSYLSQTGPPPGDLHYGAESVVVSDATLVAGGRDANDIAIATALHVSGDGDVEQIEMPLARYALAGSQSIEQVFLFGGFDASGTASSDFLTYNSEDRSFSAHSSNVPPRAYASAVSFSDGRVLVFGGEADDGTPTDSVDLYDPRIGALCPVGQLSIPRSRAMATPLPDGRALVMGGLTGVLAPAATAHVEIVDARFIELLDDCSISGGTLQNDPTDRLQVARHTASAHVLLNGTIAVVGGLGQDDEPVAQIEVYVPE